MSSWQAFLSDGRAVFRRYWKLLVLPIPLALLITIWVVASAPTMYQSQAAIWSDITSAQAAANVQAANGATPLTPAANEQSLLNELLATNSFRAAVATSSPLAAWLQANPPSTLTPSGLTGLLHGTPPLTTRIRSALLSGTSTTVDGPQVMTIGFQAQTPRLAHDTLAAILNTFVAQRAALVAQSQSNFRILDQPSIPAGPTSGASKSVETVLIGLLAGVVVTIAATAILVLLGRRKRRAGAPERPEGARSGADGIAVPVAPTPAVAPPAAVHDNGVMADAVPAPVLERADDPDGGPTAPPAAAESSHDERDGARVEGIVRDVRVVRSGSTRQVVWVVATAAGAPDIPRRSPVTLEETPHGPGTVRRTEQTPEGTDVYVELSDVLSSAPRDGMPAASDKAWVGHELTLVALPVSADARVARKSRA